MNCDKAIDHYDDFRDQFLDPSVEKVLIDHLDSCTTCSMDFEMRDMALGAEERIAEMNAPSNSVGSGKHFELFD